MSQPVVHRQEDLDKPAPRSKRRPAKKAKPVAATKHEHPPVVKPATDTRTNLERQQQYPVASEIAEFYNAVWPALRVAMNVAERKERTRLLNTHTRTYAKVSDPDLVPLPPNPEAFSLDWAPPLTRTNVGQAVFSDPRQMEAGLSQLLQRQGVAQQGITTAGAGRSLHFKWAPASQSEVKAD